MTRSRKSSKCCRRRSGSGGKDSPRSASPASRRTRRSRLCCDDGRCRRCRDHPDQDAGRPAKRDALEHARHGEGRWRERSDRSPDLGGARAQAPPFRTFKVSRDPDSAEKLMDVVGLYLSPPTNAIVLSCDEKSQIQLSTARSHRCRFEAARPRRSRTTTSAIADNYATATRSVAAHRPRDA